MTVTQIPLFRSLGAENNKQKKNISKGGRPAIFSNRRDCYLYYHYHIRLSDYNALFVAQGGVCAICGKPESKMQARGSNKTKTVDSLQVDHDHETGKIRGLVCWRCNVGILKLMDDRKLLEAAAKYLGIEIIYDNPS